MSEYSYFHVGKITLQEVQPCVDKLYQTVEAQRQEMKTDQVRAKEQLQAVVDEVSSLSLSLMHAHKCTHTCTHSIHIRIPYKDLQMASYA